jgi:hypothetical protein
MQSRGKNKIVRRSRYAAQFDALRDSIEGDPTPDEIAELAAIIKDENGERDELKREEQRACCHKIYRLRCDCDRD